MELARPRNEVPHFLPGQNSSLTGYADRYGIPHEAARGGAETTYPEYMEKLRRGTPALAPPAAPRRPAAAAAAPRSIDLQTIHVQGNVYLLAGAGSNIVVQVGDDGVIVVDTGAGAMTDRVLAAVRTLSQKEIRWVINTEFDADHTAGNQAISLAGRTVNGNPAAVVAHENASLHMVQAGVADGARPFNTYFEEGRDFPFNGEPVFLYHDPSAHTDAGTMVLFRHSDVIVAGDAFLTTTYPVVDAKNGGSITGIIRSLNKILELAVPSKLLQEGGTYVIPGHGRIADEADVVEYRDMVSIIRDRVADLIAKGMTLEQVQAAHPTLDYDGRYGADSGPWTTAMFVEAVYRELKK
jgi:cyclase